MNCYQSVQLVGLLTVWSSCWLCRAVGWSSVQINYDSQSNYFLPPNRLFRCQRAHTIMTTTTICSFFYQHKPILKMNSTQLEFPLRRPGLMTNFFLSRKLENAQLMSRSSTPAAMRAKRCESLQFFTRHFLDSFRVQVWLSSKWHSRRGRRLTATHSYTKT